MKFRRDEFFPEKDESILHGTNPALYLEDMNFFRLIVE